MLNSFEMLDRDLLRGEHAGGIARMNTRFFDMFLDPGYDDSIFVCKRIDVDLTGSFQEFVDQDRLLR